jgi:hypothetical protein
MHPTSTHPNMGMMEMKSLWPWWATNRMHVKRSNSANACRMTWRLGSSRKDIPADPLPKPQSSCGPLKSASGLGPGLPAHSPKIVSREDSTGEEG